jgi:hypothetical protein
METAAAARGKKYFGGDVVSFKSSDGNKGNGVFVNSSLKAPIEKGALVLELPLELCIFTKFKGSKDEEEVAAGGLTLPKEVMANEIVNSVASFELTLALLQECNKGSASFFAPYISILPRSFDTLPFLWSFGELKGLLEDVNNMPIFHRITDISLTYCHLCDNETIRNLIGTFESFLWAFDMCNHEPTASDITTEFSWLTKSFECRAHKTFQPGEEFSIYYGERTDIDFLLYSGFICQPPGCNELSILMIKAKLDDSKPELSKARRMLINEIDGIQAIEKDEFFIKIGGSRRESALRYFVRAASVDSKEDVQVALMKKLDKATPHAVLTEAEKKYACSLLDEKKIVYENHIRSLETEDSKADRPHILKAQIDLYRSYLAVLERTKSQLIG